jgi:hypothetical protein
MYSGREPTAHLRLVILAETLHFYRGTNS